MADNQGVWGIDIGQAGLKAIRLRRAEGSDQVIATGFDYVAHPKILSQPDAVPDDLIREALETFLGRNETQGHKLAISVPGQTSLAKFIKLPPVESSKVAEIVKYEARQQIPFDLEDVIWDYQPLGGGTEESGFMLEAEVGLFAMKRDQVMQHLQPFNDAKQEVEIIQTAPLALYNFLAYDQMGIRDDDAPEADEHVIVLDMGADNTTLMVSNGRSIWIRNVPIGGNHFTRALTKDMKLTFAKAEHLKCNATRSPDPKAVFQSLRPVFNDYVSEIQRSIGYFSSVNRDARVKKVLGVGNGFKLAGLQKFLQQNLQYEVERVDNFDAVVGDSVLNAPLFADNVMTFTVPYGLALQALDVTRVKTTLLPPEIATARKIRSKKPWAVATAAGLLTALSLSAFGYANVYESVGEGRFGQAESHVQGLVDEVKKNTDGYGVETSRNAKIVQDGQNLIGPLVRREQWMELYRAINEALPRDVGDDKVSIEDLTKKNRVKIISITTAKVDDAQEEWFSKLGGADLEFTRKRDIENPPVGAGYVVSLVGVHYRNDPDVARLRGRYYVGDKLLREGLHAWTLDREGTGNPVPIGQLGISHATLVSASTKEIDFDPNRRSSQLTGIGVASGAAGGGYGGGYGGGGDDYGGDDYGGDDYGGDDYGGDDYGGGGAAAMAPKEDRNLLDDSGVDLRRRGRQKIKQTPFTVQFFWKKTLPTERPDNEPEPGAADAGTAE